MIVCRACGGQVDEAARACPDCGMPNALRAAPSGWFSFAGRITCRQYWLWYGMPIGIIDVASTIADIATSAGGVIEVLAAIVTLVASLAGAAKRLHDRDRSAWFQLVMLIPVAGWIWVSVELMFLRGTRGPNRYGPDPLAVARR